MRLLISVLVLGIFSYGDSMETGTPSVSPFHNTFHGTDFGDHITGGSPGDYRESCVEGSVCDSCPRGTSKHVRYSNGTDSRMCCEGCGGYMRLGYDDANNPVCVCDREERVIGDCWKGSQCDVCNRTVVGSMNLIYLCCDQCVASGLKFSTTYCNCLHNGPGDSRRIDGGDTDRACATLSANHWAVMLGLVLTFLYG